MGRKGKWYRAMPKKWYRSKTLWAGVMAIMTAVGAAIEQGFDWRGVALAGFGAAVIYLRFISTSKLTK